MATVTGGLLTRVVAPPSCSAPYWTTWFQVSAVNFIESKSDFLFTGTGNHLGPPFYK